MRLVKLLLLLLIAFSFGVIVYGYKQDDRFEHRDTYTIDAAPERVWALVADPRNTSKWLPPEMCGGGLVEIKEAAAPTGTAAPAAPAPAVAEAAGSAAAFLGKRYVYLQKDRESITIEPTERVQGKRAVDKVVANTIGFEGYFPELAWGFEIAPAEGGRTTLTPLQIGRAAKPWGTIMVRMMEWSGETKKMHAALAKSVEAAAKAPETPASAVEPPAK